MVALDVWGVVSMWICLVHFNLLTLGKRSLFIINLSITIVTILQLIDLLFNLYLFLRRLGHQYIFLLNLFDINYLQLRSAVVRIFVSNYITVLLLSEATFVEQTKFKRSLNQGWLNGRLFKIGTKFGLNRILILGLIRWCLDLPFFAVINTWRL